MNREEIKVMIKDCVYSEDGITYMSDKQYNNCINIIEQLQQENQELKLELSGYRQAILKDKEMLGLKEENDKLKKQLENKYSKIGTLTNEVLYEENTKLINQQKEFIKWLENELKSWTEALNAEYDYELVQEFALKCNIYQEILSKYKEIIGDDK